MRKIASLCIALATFVFAQSQTKNHWKTNNAPEKVKTDKSVARVSFPKTFKAFDLDIPAFQQELMSIVGKERAAEKVKVSFPNADGGIEEFELVEASNFEPALQERFPEIRAYSGRGITDPYATIKVSFSPDGVQTMTFRADKENEFIEKFSEDKKTYAVFRSQRKPGALPWDCTTKAEQQMVSAINDQVMTLNTVARSGNNLKTMRLAQSCNAEYSIYFGATSSAQVGLVLAAFNNTLTRCNGVYEKDLALHLDLILNTTKVIFYNPSTDPYTTMSSWNGQLQKTLTDSIGEANYDIGHMFGSTGGGGNAGCIGCICVNGSKGSGITSPADGVPKGDNFDIDYVAHEIGHQLGANHTFSQSLEGTGVNKEVGSGITIMGYAGITSYDVAPHSIDIFHQASIAQIQSNLSGKECPVTTNITNTAPTVSVPAASYSIPRSTPFALTASATDATTNGLTYCWEQNDNSTVSGSSSIASITKASGPNWISFSPSTSPTRYFPIMRSILSGKDTTGTIGGNDAGVRVEALSSVTRTLNFRVTVRDNVTYNSVTPEVGQTEFANLAVNVVGTAGPFLVTAPNTAVSWPANSNQTVTWSVNSTNLSPINCSNVNILLSTDGGNTFSTLKANTPNDGTEVVTLPNTLSSTARIKVEAVGNIFFDISNTNFTISAPPLCGDATGLTTSNITNNSANISWNAVTGATSYAVEYKTSSATTWTVLTKSQPGTTASLTGLTGGTTYAWRIQSTCSAGPGGFVQSANFTTQSCASTLDNSTNNTIGGALIIPFNNDIKGLINVGSDVDHYKFSITIGETISITLTTLPANYNLRLVNSAGKVLNTSANSGTTSETINTTLSAGTYFARVYPSTTSIFNATSCYTLRVALGTATRLATDITGSANTISADGEFGKGNVIAYPNPVKNLLNISMTAAGNEISLFNSKGEQVMRTKATGVNSQLDVSKLASGLYLVKISKDGRLVSQLKVIKQ
jgi:hypothetical protein